mgnify:CR=1 FL=1
MKPEVKHKNDKRLNLVMDKDLHARSVKFAGQYNWSLSELIRYALKKVVK